MIDSCHSTELSDLKSALTFDKTNITDQNRSHTMSEDFRNIRGIRSEFFRRVGPITIIKRKLEEGVLGGGGGSERLKYQFEKGKVYKTVVRPAMGFRCGQCRKPRRRSWTWHQ